MPHLRTNGTRAKDVTFKDDDNSALPTIHGVVEVSSCIWLGVGSFSCSSLIHINMPGLDYTGLNQHFQKLWKLDKAERPTQTIVIPKQAWRAFSCGAGLRPTSTGARQTPLIIMPH